MRIVVSHLNFADFAGTETYVLTVAQQLERLGHDSMIYASNLGPMAEFARRQGVRVIDDQSKLPVSCDAVLAQDASTAYQLAARYPGAVRIYGLHSAHNPLHCPPQLTDVCHAVAVFNDRLRRRAEHLAHRTDVVRLRQPVDLKRFGLPSAVAEPRRRPRVLALSNHARGPRMRMIEEACRRAGLELVTIGAHAEWTPNPEQIMAGVEIVVSLGRGALEAMAGGRGVYVFGPGGADGWVTPESYPALESDGFSGRAFDIPIDSRRLAADFAGWEDGMGESNRDHVWAHHDGERHAIELVELIERVDARTPPPIDYAEELARLVRIEWYSFLRAESAIAENRRIRAEADALREEARVAAQAARVADQAARAAGEAARVSAESADSLRVSSRALTHSLRAGEQIAAQLAQANRDLDSRLSWLMETRRYRLACRIAAPLDRMRERRRGSPRS